MRTRTGSGWPPARHRRALRYGFVALTEALDIVDTSIKGAAHARSLGILYDIRIGGLVVLCAIAAATRNRAFHLAFVCVALLFEITTS